MFGFFFLVIVSIGFLLTINPDFEDFTTNSDPEYFTIYQINHSDSLQKLSWAKDLRINLLIIKAILGYIYKLLMLDQKMLLLGTQDWD